MTNQESKRRSIGLSKPGVKYQDNNEKTLNGSRTNGAHLDDSGSIAPPLAQENLPLLNVNGVVYQENEYVRNGEQDSGPHFRRRLSSPMMPAFMVSAPGKVIVFGEHAVVHGKVRFSRIIGLRICLLTLLGCNGRCNISSLIPPCHIAVQILPYRHSKVSRHISGSYMEHRLPAMGHVRQSFKEEILLRPCDKP